eukprot:CAMPEP_0185624210 /NCGR_PEP_ID=MMETSP0436-20130131/60448_1 /TAXON_ID=626734 ORGANISM="Favella taraikaensis, Strain Fe Narragansett Bay" /NCGR_SAMPLE_ID=MMETSP0436 /ASSEMBLY_ACC=CAM_ASM_000390 /LENGTH=76 /DNA_ID=CAMNT_0028266619 /DNA_START=1096 /DNA_END=1326 /DNA_ORIENTATION=-
MEYDDILNQANVGFSSSMNLSHKNRTMVAAEYGDGPSHSPMGYRSNPRHLKLDISNQSVSKKVAITQPDELLKKKF